MEIYARGVGGGGGGHAGGGFGGGGRGVGGGGRGGGGYGPGSMYYGGYGMGGGPPTIFSTIFLTIFGLVFAFVGFIASSQGALGWIFMIVGIAIIVFGIWLYVSYKKTQTAYANKQMNNMGGVGGGTGGNMGGGFGGQGGDLGGQQYYGPNQQNQQGNIPPSTPQQPGDNQQIP